MALRWESTRRRWRRSTACAHLLVDDLAGLAATAERGTALIEIPVDRRRNVEIHRRIADRAGAGAFCAQPATSRQQGPELELGLGELGIGIASRATMPAPANRWAVRSRSRALREGDAELAVLGGVHPADRARRTSRDPGPRARRSPASARSRGSPPTAGVGCSSPASSTARARLRELGVDRGREVLDVRHLDQLRLGRGLDPDRMRARAPARSGARRSRARRGPSRTAQQLLAEVVVDRRVGAPPGRAGERRPWPRRQPLRRTRSSGLAPRNAPSATRSRSRSSSGTARAARRRAPPGRARAAPRPRPRGPAPPCRARRRGCARRAAPPRPRSAPAARRSRSAPSRSDGGPTSGSDARANCGQRAAAERGAGPRHPPGASPSPRSSVMCVAPAAGGAAPGSVSERGRKRRPLRRSRRPRHRRRSPRPRPARRRPGRRSRLVGASRRGPISAQRRRHVPESLRAPRDDLGGASPSAAIANPSRSGCSQQNQRSPAQPRSRTRPRSDRRRSTASRDADQASPPGGLGQQRLQRVERFGRLDHVDGLLVGS